MAAAFVRTKRVTDPLDEKVKALLRGGGGGDDDDWRLLYSSGYTSSGSEHEGASALSGNLHGFFFHMDEDDDLGRDQQGGERSDDDEGKRKNGSSSSSSLVPSAEMVRDLMNVRRDRFRKILVGVVTEAVERLGALRESRSAFRRAVMASLRDSGYNAGMCKARWENSDDVTAGNYEYIDVVRSEGRRYIVDVDFAGEFEIARPTEEYKRVVEELPRVYVGKAEEVRKAVRVIADAAKRSLRARDMHLPPWRKVKYMHNKWLGPYKRTTNPTTTTAAASMMLGMGREVQCRAVGFTPARIAMPPPATARIAMPPPACTR